MQIHSQHHLIPSRAALKRWAVTAGLSGFFVVSSAFADDLADAQRLVRGGQLNEALALVDKAIAARPKDLQMRFLRGVILSEQDKTNDAIAHFLRMTEDFPELPEPYNNLATLYAKQNELDKARAALQMAIRTNPAYAVAYENLGDVHTRLAGQAYSRALQLDSSSGSLPLKLKLIRELVDASRGRAGAAAPATAAAQPPSAAPTPATTQRATAPAPAPTATPTPAAATPAPAAASADASKAAVEAAVRNWARAWSSKDLAGYFAAYGKDFDPAGSQSRSAWEAERRARISGKRSISVSLSDLSISVNGDKARATFRQAYKADSLDVNSRKTLDLVRSGDRWVIVRESTGG